MANNACFKQSSATIKRRMISSVMNIVSKLMVALMLMVLLISSPDDGFGSGSGGLALVRAENRDFYKILGIPRSAKEKEIKKAFKKMSIKYHPDKNKGDEDAMKKYQDITAAYDALSDAERRRKYDQYGEEGLNKPDGGGRDPFDFFGDFFGGG